MDRVIALLAPASSGTSGVPWWVPVATGLVALAVGWFGRQATLGSARIAAAVEDRKLAHEKDKYGDERRDKLRRDFFAASEAMTVVRLGQATSNTRRVYAQKARAALVAVRLTIRGPLKEPKFDRLLTELDRARSDADLDSASELWPDVEKAILRSSQENL
jgi:hypothetical protein